jgi:hypothetical protein
LSAPHTKRPPREWQTYPYYNPNHTLKWWNTLERSVSQYNAPPKVKTLRTQGLKKKREEWDAAIFCYLFNQATGLNAGYSTIEDSDFDSILRWEQDDGVYYAPVQLKELVPAETNPHASIEALLKKCKEKYVTSESLILAIKINRQTQYSPEAFKNHGINVWSIWVFGSICPNRSKWLLSKHSNNEYSYFEFSLPE